MVKYLLVSASLFGSFSLYAATATLMSSTQPKLKATVTLEEKKDGINVVIVGSGLGGESVHGIHVHEKGVCEGPKYESAGGHFNPHKKPHSGPNDPNRHLGDLGNIHADEKGSVHHEVFLKGVTKADFESLIGKSVVLHANVDDMKSQPAGNSGDRIACGVIRK